MAPSLGAAFHTSWFGFFASFYSTFAAPALNAYIVPDLGLTGSEIQTSNSAAVGGTIFFRLAMGLICDKFGARRGLGFLLLGTTPAIVGMMFATGPIAYILLRCIIGFSLATFVACQTWCAQMVRRASSTCTACSIRHRLQTPPPPPPPSRPPPLPALAH